MVIESVLLIQDLDHKTFDHVDTENRRRTIEEQIEFLKSVHDEVQQHYKMQLNTDYTRLVDRARRPMLSLCPFSAVK